jgi:hypothetical protein
MNSMTFKGYMTQLLHWAQSGSQLIYISIALGVLVALILFRTFFWNLAGFVHCIGFSLGASPNSAKAAEPGVARNSRIKLVLGTLLPPGTGYAAYVFLPRLFPAFFQ